VSRRQDRYMSTPLTKSANISSSNASLSLMRCMTFLAMARSIFCVAGRRHQIRWSSWRRQPIKHQHVSQPASQLYYYVTLKYRCTMSTCDFVSNTQPIKKNVYTYSCMTENMIYIMFNRSTEYTTIHVNDQLWLLWFITSFIHIVA